MSLSALNEDDGGGARQAPGKLGRRECIPASVGFKQKGLHGPDLPRSGSGHILRPVPKDPPTPKKKPVSPLKLEMTFDEFMERAVHVPPETKAKKADEQ